MSSLPTPAHQQGALDVLLGQDIADPDLPRRLAETPTETLVQGLSEAAESFKAQSERWRRQVGFVLHALRKRLPHGEYEKVMEDFAAETGFSVRSLYDWRRNVEGVLGALPDGPGRPRKPKPEIAESANSAPSSPADPFASDDEVAEGELVEHEESAPRYTHPLDTRAEAAARREAAARLSHNGGGSHHGPRIRAEAVALIRVDPDVALREWGRADAEKTVAEVEGWIFAMKGALRIPAERPSDVETYFKAGKG